MFIYTHSCLCESLHCRMSLQVGISASMSTWHSGTPICCVTHRTALAPQQHTTPPWHTHTP